MDLEAYVTHQLPGRLRLKIPAVKGHPELLRRMATAVSSASDVKSVEGNSVTGSLLIHYSPATYKNLEELGSVLGDSKLHVAIHASRPPVDRRSRPARRGERVGPSAAAKAIASFFRDLDREIREATDNEIDLKVLLPLAAGGLGFLAFRRKSATPLWLTLMIFAFHSFLTLHGVAVAQGGDEFTLAGSNGAPSEEPG